MCAYGDTAPFELMDADWYVDPLGRFEGRYFDGAQWTDQVSDGGIAAVDPDWDPSSLPTGYITGALDFDESETPEPAVQTIGVSEARLRWGLLAVLAGLLVVERRCARSLRTAPRRRRRSQPDSKL